MRVRSLALICDASARTGFGHWVRSTTLADEMARRGWRVVVVHAPDVDARAIREGAAREWAHVIAGRDSDSLRSALNSLDPEVIIVDTYRLDAATVEALRAPQRRTVVIDDLNDRGVLDADVIVNQNLGAEDFVYRTTQSETVLLLGPCYAMLRPQFAQLRGIGIGRLDQQPNRPSRVFVLMGGSDATGALPQVLHGCLEAFSSARIRAVVPPGAERAVKALRRHEDIDTIAPTPEIAEQMLDADFVVTAGGTSVWELCALGRPFGVVVVADNQQEATGRLARIGATVRLGGQPVEPRELTASLRDATADPAALVERARRASEITDGAGCARVADVVERTAHRAVMPATP